MWRGLSLLAASEVGGAVRRNVAIYTVYGIALVALIAAGGFVAAAAHVLLAERYGTAIASLILAGVLLVAALALMLTGLYLRHRSRRKTALATTALMVAPAVAPTAIRALASSSALGVGVVAGAVALGALAGRKLVKND